MLYKEKAMATHSSTLAWKIPWAEEPGGLHSMGLLRVGRLSDFTFTFHFHALEKEMATHSSVLAWRITGMGEPGGLPSMGSHRVGHDWSDFAAAMLYYWNKMKTKLYFRAVIYTYLGIFESLGTYLCKYVFVVAVPSHVLSNSRDCSLPASSVHGIFQAKILQWVAIFYSREFFLPRVLTHISCVSCTGKQILYHCTTWDVPNQCVSPK